MSERSDALAVPVDVTMRRPTLFGVPAMPILAAPRVLRRAQVEEAGALAALLSRAFEAERSTASADRLPHIHEGRGSEYRARYPTKDAEGGRQPLAHSHRLVPVRYRRLAPQQFGSGPRVNSELVGIEVRSRPEPYEQGTVSESTPNQYPASAIHCCLLATHGSASSLRSVSGTVAVEHIASQRSGGARHACSAATAVHASGRR